jgi:UDP-N-acetylmuramoyl-tripeptide--D-alanyl-D-alanine ligase
LAKQVGTKIIAMGDMAELGTYEEEAHREIGAYAKQKGIDLLYTIGSSSQQAVESFGKDARHFSQMDALAQHLLSLLDPTVTLLIKGSRSAGMDKLVSTLIQEGD